MAFTSASSDNNKITVALVDDSSVIRGALRRLLQDDDGIEVVSSVSNGELAIDAAKQKKPDVMILDVEMPVMDGLQALPSILNASPETKIVMCSSLTEKGATVSMKAMSLGAVECIVKPSSASDSGIGSDFQKSLLALVNSLRPASKVKKSTPNVAQQPAASIPSALPPSASSPSSVQLLKDPKAYAGKPSIVAIGSSTGGPQALFNVLKHCKDFNVPIVITQHMPATFTTTLTNHIASQTGIDSFEAEDGMKVENGCIYVARGGKHMTFNKKADGMYIVLDDGPQENYCKPAVDTMMRSLIPIHGQRILFVILTGMGSDGLKGGQDLVKLGGRVIAQDEATSVVWGMPGAVAQAGICSEVLPLDDVGPWIRKSVLG